MNNKLQMNQLQLEIIEKILKASEYINHINVYDNCKDEIDEKDIKIYVDPESIN